jgi:5-methylcytosine-specific restriction protein A
MQRALKICRKPGCSALVKSGYCPKHAHVIEERKRESFEELDAKKTPEQRKFYSCSRWTEVSRIHRVNEPLCRRCKGRGIVKVAEVTHHNPPRDVLIARGLDPYDDQHLESLCFDCHQEDLRAKWKQH